MFYQDIYDLDGNIRYQVDYYNDLIVSMHKSSIHSCMKQMTDSPEDANYCTGVKSLFTWYEGCQRQQKRNAESSSKFHLPLRLQDASYGGFQYLLIAY